jgi:hypothetical protein
MTFLLVCLTIYFGWICVRPAVIIYVSFITFMALAGLSFEFTGFENVANWCYQVVKFITFTNS